jgi:hypothetical protein
LADKDAASGALAKACRRSLYGMSLIAVVLAEEGPAQRACLAHTDVQRALALVREDSEPYPESDSEWAWAMLRLTHPEAAAKVAKFLLHDERGNLNEAVQRRLSPLDATGAYQESWMALIKGHPEQAPTVLQKCAEEGVPLPMVR